jgi:hypothetical protein
MAAGASVPFLALGLGVYIGLGFPGLPGREDRVIRSGLAAALWATGGIWIWGDLGTVPTDVIARLIAQKLSESLGQQFYVENQVGAGGNIGMGAVAGAACTGQQQAGGTAQKLEARSGSKSGPIKVGILEDRSGIFALFGIPKYHGALLPVEEINNGFTIADKKWGLGFYARAACKLGKGRPQRFGIDQRRAERLWIRVAPGQDRDRHVRCLQATLRRRHTTGPYGLEDANAIGVGREPAVAAEIRIRLPLTLAEVASGARKTLRVQVLDACGGCGGTGAEGGAAPVRCDTCNGAGEVRRVQRSMLGQLMTVTPCPTCGGEGTRVEESMG